jgi:hypothetical protein
MSKLPSNLVVDPSHIRLTVCEQVVSYRVLVHTQVKKGEELDLADKLKKLPEAPEHSCTTYEIAEQQQKWIFAMLHFKTHEHLTDMLQVICKHTTYTFSGPRSLTQTLFNHVSGSPNDKIAPFFNKAEFQKWFHELIVNTDQLKKHVQLAREPAAVPD